MPLNWTPIGIATDNGIAIQVATTQIGGRAAYSFRIGKLRDDESIGAYIPVTRFANDDGVKRSKPDLRHLVTLLLQASDMIDTHVAEADAARLQTLCDRDERKAQRDSAHGNSRVGQGLGRFTSDETRNNRTNNHTQNLAARRETGRARKGKKG